MRKILSDDYLDYLKSDTWQKLRSKRLIIDKFRCQVCHRPFDLQVHHLNYPAELGTENPYTDLITLCKRCHEDIERNKRDYNAAEEWKKKRDADMKIIYSAIVQNIENDLYKGGKRDYCNQDVIREDFGPKCDSLNIGYISRVQEYFRNRRYEIILDMMARGYTASEVVKRTGFSHHMVHRVYDRPLNAKTLIEKETKYND